jgi:SAM-dependent methyltransferase
MLSDPVFKEKVTEIICENTGLPAEWFKGKRVLDVACGQGRWSYGLRKLGAEVVAFDGSASGVERTRAACEEVGGVEVTQRNLLEDLRLEPTFDLVHAFGCLHHTGNTHFAFENVMKAVKPGGYLFLMVYVEPEEAGSYAYYNEVDSLHRKLRNLGSAERVAYLKDYLPEEESLHMWFDAASPSIKERYESVEVEGWFTAAGFEDVRRTRTENLFLVGRKRLES